MNIFKWLTSQSGKIALSAAQAVGLSAVVGVAGVAAFQYLDAPTDNTSFNLGGQYNPGEVVYVAGASGGSYGANGEVQSAFMATPSKAIEMTEKMTLAQKRAEEYDDSVVLSEPAPSNPQAYQMGGTEGLGMGANRANEEELKNNPMALAQQSLSGVTDAISRAQAQAQQQAAAAANGQPQQGGAGALASANRDWGSSAATRGLSGGGGNAFNSSFVVQDSGKGGKGAAGAGAVQSPDQVAKNFRNQISSIQEGARLRARSNFGQNELLADGRDTSLGNARTSREGKDLEFIRKRSVDAAKNKNRAANEGSRAFLASTKISGGMTVVGDNVTTGQGQGSKDFEAATESQLRGIQSYATGNLDEEALQRKRARDNIRTWMWIAIPVALAAMVSIPIAIASSGWFFGVGYALAAAIAAVALAPVITLLSISAKYANTYGGSSLSTWGMTIAGILTAGIGAAFIPGVGFAVKWATWAQLLLGGGAAGLGAAAAWWATSATEDATLDSGSLNIGGEENAPAEGEKGNK